MYTLGKHAFHWMCRIIAYSQRIISNGFHCILFDNHINKKLKRTKDLLLLFFFPSIFYSKWQRIVRILNNNFKWLLSAYLKSFHFNEVKIFDSLQTAQPIKCSNKTAIFKSSIVQILNHSVGGIDFVILFNVWPVSCVTSYLR